MRMGDLRVRRVGDLRVGDLRVTLRVTLRVGDLRVALRVTLRVARRGLAALTARLGDIFPFFPLKLRT